MPKEAAREHNETTLSENERAFILKQCGRKKADVFWPGDLCSRAATPWSSA
jgi:hypothetical protein